MNPLELAIRLAGIEHDLHWILAMLALLVALLIIRSAVNMWRN